MKKLCSVLVLLACFTLTVPMNVKAAGNDFVLSQAKTNVPEELGQVYYGIYNFEMNGTMRAKSITAAHLSVSLDTNGIYTDVTTGSNFTAAEIGVKNLKVQKKNWLGLWGTVATTNGSTTNNDFYSAAGYYTGAEVGEHYRVQCTHFADSLSVQNESDSFIYRP